MVGFWTAQNGISKELNSPKTEDLAIIWPGQTTNVPKGWEFPSSGNKLRVGVPVKKGFSEFVKVEKDAETNAVKATGFCIDVFEEAKRTLPYPDELEIEYIPFGTLDGQRAGNYDDLVYQVFLQNYDAVVGDVTVTARGPEYADFTHPHTEPGAATAAPTKDSKTNEGWTLTKPLTVGLWLTIGAFFIVVWTLEHRVNKKFGGLPTQQENVVSNSTRPAATTQLFVVLVLTPSYNANLTPMLTPQQLKSTDTTKKGEHVGFQNGSLVTGVPKEGDGWWRFVFEQGIHRPSSASSWPHRMQEHRWRSTGSWLTLLPPSSLQGLEHAIAGTSLYVVGPNDDNDIEHCWIHKRDVMKASVMLEKKKEYGTILAFDVKVTPEARELADYLGVKIFIADIICHLFGQFKAYIDKLKEEKKKEAAVFPCVLKIMPDCVFSKRDPIVLGVDVTEGTVKVVLGLLYACLIGSLSRFGRIAAIINNHKPVDYAKKGQQVAIEIIGNNPDEQQKMLGRHFMMMDKLVSKISRKSLDALNEYCGKASLHNSYLSFRNTPIVPEASKGAPCKVSSDSEICGLEILRDRVNTLNLTVLRTLSTRTNTYSLVCGWCPNQEATNLATLPQRHITGPLLRKTNCLSDGLTTSILLLESLHRTSPSQDPKNDLTSPCTESVLEILVFKFIIFRPAPLFKFIIFTPAPLFMTRSWASFLELEFSTCLCMNTGSLHVENSSSRNEAQLLVINKGAGVKMINLNKGAGLKMINLNTNISKTLSVQGDVKSFLGSCDGLVLCKLSNSKIVVVNPSLKQFVLRNRGPVICLCGRVARFVASWFGHHPHTKEYVLVLVDRVRRTLRFRVLLCLAESPTHRFLSPSLLYMVHLLRLPIRWECF
ncbi:hypothetical protein OROHE_017962 [Orobanche hederae]